MKTKQLVSQAAALFLCLTLCRPSHAFALRIRGVDSPNIQADIRAGLEEKLAPRTNIIPIVTPLTVVNQRLKVDEDAVPRYLKHLAAMGAKALLVVGATGEFHRMDRELRRSAIQLLTTGVKGTFTVFANITAEDETEVLENARIAKKAGVDVLVISPLFYLNNEGDIEAHLDRLHRETQLPVALYNNPGVHRGARISPPIVARLWTAGRVCAIKDSSGDLNLLGAYIKTGIPTYQGDEGNIAAALEMGARGTVGSSGNVWRLLQDMYPK